MGTSAPPKNKPYQPIYQSGGGSVANMLFPDAQQVSASSAAPQIRPTAVDSAPRADRQQYLTNRFSGAPAATPTLPQQTVASAQTPSNTYEQQIAYAMRLLNPNLFPRG